MHSRSVQEGHSVPFRSEWNYSTCMSSVRVKREDESRAFRLLLLLRNVPVEADVLCLPGSDVPATQAVSWKK